MPFFSFLKDDAAVADVFLHTWDRFSHLGRFLDHTICGSSDLTIGERELIAAYVSGLNECSFCFDIHKQVAQHHDVDENILKQLLDNVDSASVDDRLKPIFTYVGKLTKTPAMMTQGDADAVFAAGWTEDALHDAVSVCCAFNFMNRLMDGHGIGKLSSEKSSVLSGRLSQFGYDRTKAMAPGESPEGAAFRVPPKQDV